MFERILLATDFSPSSRAALFASISLGTRCLARIDAVHVLTYIEDVFQVSRFAVPDEEWQKQLEKSLLEYFPERLYPNSGRKILVGSSITDEILKHARSEPYSLIVSGTHGRKGVSRLILGSVSQELIRSSEIPVMVVREATEEAEKYQGYNRILVPTDFSDTSMKALEFAIRFANFLQADLHLIHVVDVPEMGYFQKIYRFPEMEIPETCELNVDKTLQKMIEEREIIGKTVVATLTGDPAEEIQKYAEEKSCDFVILGTHGRRGIKRVLVGSVTARIAAGCKIPVITIAAGQ